jgi:hypothetical protein
LLVDTAHVDSVIAFNLQGNTFWGMNLHWMAIPYIQYDTVPSLLDPVTNTHELQ